MPKVSDYMSKKLETLTLSDRVYHAFSAMELHGIRHIPIVDGDGALHGIVSDRDLKRHISEAFREEGGDKMFVYSAMLHELNGLMTSDVVTFYPDDPLKDAAKGMLEKKISSVVVLEPGTRKPVGILTDTDLVALLVEFLDKE